VRYGSSSCWSLIARTFSQRRKPSKWLPYVFSSALVDACCLVYSITLLQTAVILAKETFWLATWFMRRGRKKKRSHPSGAPEGPGGVVTISVRQLPDSMEMRKCWFTSTVIFLAFFSRCLQVTARGPNRAREAISSKQYVYIRKICWFARMLRIPKKTLQMMFGPRVVM